MAPHITNPEIPCVQWGRGYIVFPTFDAEFKSAKIQNPLCPLGRGEGLGSMFQLLMLSSNLPISKISCLRNFVEKLWAKIILLQVSLVKYKWFRRIFVYAGPLKVWWKFSIQIFNNKYYSSNNISPLLQINLFTVYQFAAHATKENI